MGMKIPCGGEIGMGKFPHSSLKAHNIFPIHGLAVIVKKNSQFAASPLMGKFIFTIPAKPFMGKLFCAFCDSWGNLFFPTPGFAGRGEKSHPYFSSLWDWAIGKTSHIW